MSRSWCCSSKFTATPTLALLVVVLMLLSLLHLEQVLYIVPQIFDKNDGEVTVYEAESCLRPRRNVDSVVTKLPLSRPCEFDYQFYGIWADLLALWLCVTIYD